jgi:hypothetical protein
MTGRPPSGGDVERWTVAPTRTVGSRPPRATGRRQAASLGRDGPRRRRVLLRVGSLAGAISVAVLLLASCGGGVDPNSVAHLGQSGPTTTAAPAADAGGFPSLQQMYEAGLAFAGCMRSHGDPGFPDPQLVDSGRERGVTIGNGTNENTPQYQSADRACKHLLPNGGSGPTQGQIQAGMAQLLKASECMRSHGVPNFPDPTESNGGKAIGFQSIGIDQNSPQYQAARKACRSLTPLLGGP